MRILLQSTFYLLDGDWHWPMASDAVFCSDVLFSQTEAFVGTRAIFHPDDVGLVKESLATGGPVPSLTFRIITTYGEVKTISGENVVAVEELQPDWQEEALQAAAQSLEGRAEQEHLQLLKNLDDRTSRFNGIGRWYHNASTHQTWYADFVYALHGLPAQSLNAHLHTFHPFVHPDDRSFVTEYTDKAFRERTPLHMDYRIVVAGQQKWVSYKAQWFYSEKGEEILGGIFQDSSEQKTAEREAESFRNLVHFQRQQLLYDEQQAALGHWQINLLTRKVTYSDQYYRIFGLKPHSLVPTLNTFLNYVHPEDREKVEAANKRLVYEHAVQDLEYRIVRNDGKTRYLLQKGRLATVEDELIVSGIIQDITVQRMLEKKVAGQADALQLQQFLAGQSDAQAALLSWVMDMDENTIHWSESFYKLLGHPKAPPGNVTEKTLFTLLHPQDLKAFRQQWTLGVNEKQPASFDVRFLLRGAVQYMKAVFHFYRLNEKDYFIGTLQNTTAEQVLQQQLSQRVQLAESLSDNTLDRVIITDVHNTVLFWNRACEQSYGFKKTEAIGENFFDLFPQLKTEAAIQVFQRALRGEKVVQEESAWFLGQGYFNLYLMPLYQENEVTGVLHIIHDVTREVELRNGLNDRLQLIEGLVHSSADRIVVLDRHMNYLYWNKKAEEYYSLAKEQVIGRNILELFPGFRNDPSYGEFRKVLRGETVNIPATLTADRTLYFDTSLSPIKDENGEVTAVLWMVHDRSSEYDLVQTQKKAADILNSVNAAFIELDNHYRYQFLNEVAVQYLGKSREELLGKVMWEAFPQAIGTPGYEAVLKGVAEKERSETEYFSTVFNKWVFQSVIPKEDGVLLFFYDRQDIKEAQSQIQENEALLRSTEEVAHTGSYETDLLQHTVRFSDGMYRLFGEEPGSFEPLPEWMDRRSHPDDILLVKNILDKAVADRQPYCYTHRICRKDGEWRTVEAHGRVVCDAGGKVIKLQGLVQDITERQKALAELRRSEEGSRNLLNLLQHAPDAYLVLTPDLIIHMASEAYLDATLTTRKDLVGRYMFDVFPDNPAAPEAHAVKNLQASFDQVRQTKKPHRMAIQHYDVPRPAALGGGFEEKYWSPVNTPVLNSAGEVVYIIHRVMDVTEVVKKQGEIQDLTKQTEILATALRELKDNRELLKTTIDSSLEMIQVFEAVRNEAGEIVDFIWLLNNKTAERIYGDVIGKSLLRNNPGVVEAGIFETFKRVVETGLPDQSERHYVHEQFDGWFFQSTVRLNDGVSTTTTDITERKKAEAQLTEQTHYLRRITETVPDMMSVMALPSRRIHYLNKETFAAHGFDPDVMLQKTAEELGAMIHPEDRHRLQEFFQRVAGAVDEDTVTTEYRAMDLQGEWKWFLVRGKVFQRDAAGQVTHILNAIENITARKKSEQELQTAKEILQATLDTSLYMVQAFVAMRDADGKIVDFVWLYTNKKWKEHYGRDMAGKRLLTENPAVLENDLFEKFIGVTETGVSIEHEHQYADEQLHGWFYQTMTKMGDGFVLTMVEMTERKKSRTGNTSPERRTGSKRHR